MNKNIFIDNIKLSREKRKIYNEQFNEVEYNFILVKKNKDINYLINYIRENINKNFDNHEIVLKKINDSIEKFKESYFNISTSLGAKAIIELSMLELTFFSFNDDDFVNSLIITNNIKHRKSKLYELMVEKS